MNNKGFSLVELIVVVTLIALISIVLVVFSNDTVSLTQDEAYKIVQSNVVNACDKYIMECENDLIECFYIWNNDKTSISANELINAGYFTEIVNPINNQDLSKCLIIDVTRVEENYKYQINDNNCK